MFRNVLKFAGAALGWLLDIIVTVFVIAVVLIVSLLFLLMPSLFIPNRRPSVGFSSHHLH
jgi:hypothetical protein